MSKLRTVTIVTFIMASMCMGVQVLQTPETLAQNADAIWSGTVHTIRSYETESGAIRTKVGMTVHESLKGIFGETVRLDFPGGILATRSDIGCGSCELETDSDYLIYAELNEAGNLELLHYVSSAGTDFAALLSQLQLAELSGADISDLTFPESGPMGQIMTVGVLPGETGYGSRFLSCDRGEPIEYLVDMDLLPAGLTSNQAMTALSNAFSAWEAETSLEFKFAGYESFGMSAGDVAISDGRIRIQLHDSYGEIDNGSTTLGRGGRYSSYSSSWPDGGLGAKVGTNEFDITTRGYLVMEHTKATLSDADNFEEVLCHELGHVLSLGHSSETPGETDPVLADAQMYAWIHGGGRGASLNSWDTSNILDFYPTNTPPYGYDRIIRALSSQPPQAPLSSGVNQVLVSGYDLQDSVTASIASSTGGFTLETGNTVYYEPDAYYSDHAEASPGGYYDVCYLRFSDGTNLSPPVSVRVIQLLRDYYGDLLQDSWVTANSVTGGPSDDDDNDGFTNLEEWFLGSDPKDDDSNLKVALSGSTVSWDSRLYELYQLQSSSNLTNGFADIGNPQVADSTNDTATIEMTADQTFFRLQRVK